MADAMIMVFFRPSFSAAGKAKSAPKKQPALESQNTTYIWNCIVSSLTWKVDTMLPWVVSRTVLAMPSILKSRMNEFNAIVPPITAVSYPTAIMIRSDLCCRD